MGKANVKAIAAGALFAAAVAAVLALCAPNAAWAIDEREPNDTYNTAQQITLGTTVYGNTYQADISPHEHDYDYYVINIPRTDSYRFTYSMDYEDLSDIFFDISNAYHEYVARKRDDGISLRPVTDTIVLQKGVHYIAVWTSIRRPVQYHIKLSPAVDKTAITKLTSTKKSVTVKFNKRANTTRYEVRYATKSSMKGAKVKTVMPSKSKLKVTKLKRNKKYYFQVRVVKSMDGKNFYSGWSVKKSIRTKR